MSKCVVVLAVVAIVYLSVGWLRCSWRLRLGILTVVVLSPLLLLASIHRPYPAKSDAEVEGAELLLTPRVPDVLHFPEDRSLGVVLIRANGSSCPNAWEILTEARGDVPVPDGKDLMVRVSPDAYTGFAGLTALRGSDVKRLDLAGTDVTDCSLASVAELTSLRSLDLTRTNLTGDGLAWLAGLQSLRALHLDGTAVDDAGLARLSGLTSLQVLDLWGTPITDGGLAHLAGLEDLQALRLTGTYVTDDGLAHLSHLASLRTLHLGFMESVDGPGLRHLRELPGLRWLSLEWDHISEDTLACLASLPSLRRLSLTSPGATDAALQQLRQALPHCEVVPDDFFPVLEIPSGD